MNVRKFLVAGAVVSSLCFATARAELAWEKKELDLHPAIGDATAVAVFKYVNKGDKSIHFNSVRTSCGCTVAALQKNDVAPGEKGEITATLKIGDRSGLQTKTVTVDTDDAKEPTTILTLKANITQLLDVQPAFVFWKVGEAAKPKTILAKLVRERPSRASMLLLRVLISPRKWSAAPRRVNSKSTCSPRTPRTRWEQR